MKELNKDIALRDKLIFGKYQPGKYRFGGIRSFCGMDINLLKNLLDQNFIDPEERQNNSPSVIEICSFMEDYPSYTAHGYTVVDTRDDYRVSLEGVEKGEPAYSSDELRDYMVLFAGADEFDESTMRCWFD